MESLKHRMVFIVLVFALIITLTGCDGGIHEDTKPIKSLKLTSQEHIEQNGVFILGIGTYQSNLTVETKYYLYILRNEGFTLQEINSNKVEIVETNEIEPCLKGKYDSSERLSTIWDCVVYVPIGTIFEEYTITLP